MIYLIIITILVLALAGLGFYTRKTYLLNVALSEQVIKGVKAPIIIGRVSRYNEKEVDLFLGHPELVDLMIKIYSYKIFMKTDSIRSLQDTEKKVGHLDALHESHSFFVKIKAKIDKIEKKEDKSGQSLV